MRTPDQASSMHRTTAQRSGEAGFMLLAVVVMVALVLIALAVAAPVVARDLRRDKEVESEHRAQQYVRAIRLYQRKFNKQYPPSIEALEKSNNVRFLRQQYVDPLTGKADWRIIHVGENKTTVKGFFGEPLGGLNSSGPGLGSASGMASGGDSNNTSRIGSTPVLGSGFQGASVGTPDSGTSGGSGSTGASGSSPSAFGSGGGAGPIMGVGSSRSGTSLLTPNEQGSYESWEFLYDPRIEAMYAKGAMGGGIGSQSAAGFGTDVNNAPKPPTGPAGGGNITPQP